MTVRPRRGVSPVVARILPLLGFRYSQARDAYVLRAVGRRVGPVVVSNGRRPRSPVTRDDAAQAR